MSDDAVARQGSWQAFDQVLCLLNSLDVPADMTADQMRRKIYGLVHGLRPGGSQSLSEWRDISTAPKDGTLIVYLADEGFSTIAYWAEREGMWFLPALDVWQETTDALHQMTAWMPLPDGPGEVNP